jgi:pimeloyl-ACP methyl ester carboxylesterase
MTTRTLMKTTVAGLPVTEWSGNGSSARTVFGLPGLASSATAWAHLADTLPDARVISLDLRGRGDAQALAGPTGLRAHARDVARVIEDLDLDDVILIGHSMGAYLAPLVWDESPSRVVKLVLVDGGIRPKLPFFMGPRMTRLAFTKQLGGLDREWPSVEAVAKKGKVYRMVASRPDLQPIVLTMIGDDLGGIPGALRPRADVQRCVADAVDAFWGDDVEGALESLKVPADVFLAEHAKSDRDKAFISDAAVAPWLTKQPLLNVRRLPGNHVTILFHPDVAAACTVPGQG